MNINKLLFKIILFYILLFIIIHLYISFNLIDSAIRTKEYFNEEVSFINIFLVNPIYYLKTILILIFSLGILYNRNLAILLICITLFFNLIILFSIKISIFSILYFLIITSFYFIVGWHSNSKDIKTKR